MSEPNWGQWIWDNRERISNGIAALYHWLFPKKDDNQLLEQQPAVLVLGPGGVGKTTLAMVLSGRHDLLFDLPGAYDESLEVESFPLKGATDLEMVVPPGQAIRREATWDSLLEDLKGGKFRGMIFVSSYGYHNHELGAMTSYKDHRLYQGNKEEFLRAFLEHKRNEEISVLRAIADKVAPPDGKFWILSLVTKQDIWWDDRAAVESFYSQGDYAAEIAKIANAQGIRRFRHELALCSLLINNFETGKGELLKTNSAGYDHKRHAQSLREMLLKMEALRNWEIE